MSVFGRRCFCTRFLGLVSAVALCGCFGGAPPKPKTVPVSGSVSYNGQPVVGATVTFLCDDAPRPARGVTDKDGKFQLSTFEINEGAVIGEHKITVVKDDPAKSAAAPVGPAAGADPSQLTQQYTKAMADPSFGKPASLLPVKYATLQDTTLHETVTAEGPNQFVLTLSD